VTNTEAVIVEPLPNPHLEDPAEIEALRSSVVAGVGTFSILITNPALQAAAITHWLNYFLREVGPQAVTWELCNAVRQAVCGGMEFPQAAAHPACPCPVDHESVSREYNEFIASASADSFEKAVALVGEIPDEDVTYRLGGWITRLGDAIAGAELPR
jgi:hypothetical protein